MMKDFKGKVAVITGGASGIGRGLAIGFAKRGMKIVLADIDKENLDKVAKELEGIGAEVMTQITDVSDPEQVALLADAAYERFGSVNVLCNNAGVGGGGPINLITLENWNWPLGVNLFGVIYGIHFFLKRMLASKEPCHIVNTSSMSGLLSGANNQPYPASKYAVVAISESLALECYNTNVGVSVLCPGFVSTNIIENTRMLNQRRPGLWQPTPELIQQSEIDWENIMKILKSGMAPEKLAELVIKAIENNILFVLTHPEYIPLIKSRFERIFRDTSKLFEGIEEKTEVKSKVFKNDKPAFCLTYPEDFIELKPNPMIFRLKKPVFLGSKTPNFDLVVFVSKSSMKRLEKAAQRIAKRIKVQPIHITSNKPITLRDGTAAYESVIEFKSAGVSKVKSVHLSVLKDEYWISVSIFTNASLYNENLKDILHSLEFN